MHSHLFLTPSFSRADTFAGVLCVSLYPPCVISTIALREDDCSVGSSSLGKLECAERRKWAVIWLGFARAVAESSEPKLPPTGASDAAPLPRFLGGAPSTLQGWRIRLGFCSFQGLSAGAPSMAHALDFTVSLLEGCKAERGQGRCRSAVCCLSTMSSAAFKCQLRAFSECPASPLIRAWRERGKWVLRPFAPTHYPRHALPCLEGTPGGVIDIAQAAARSDAEC